MKIFSRHPACGGGIREDVLQAPRTYVKMRTAARSPCGTGRSNLTWQISCGIGYQTPWSDVSLTYRYLSFEQGSSAAEQHLWAEGPMIMANLKF